MVSIPSISLCFHPFVSFVLFPSTSPILVLPAFFLVKKHVGLWDYLVLKCKMWYANFEAPNCPKGCHHDESFQTPRHRDPTVGHFFHFCFDGLFGSKLVTAPRNCARWPMLMCNWCFGHVAMSARTISVICFRYPQDSSDHIPHPENFSMKTSFLKFGLEQFRNAPWRQLVGQLWWVHRKQSCKLRPGGFQNNESYNIRNMKNGTHTDKACKTCHHENMGAKWENIMAYRGTAGAWGCKEETMNQILLEYTYSSWFDQQQVRMVPNKTMGRTFFKSRKCSLFYVQQY